jgi:hypothetical protein
MNSPVVFEICLSFLKRYLSDFRGCPRTPAGWNRFAEALQLSAVSVEHLEAILKTFDEEFPTVRQINDVSMNLRPRYELKEDQRAVFEREYGKPEAFKLYPPDTLAMHWQAFRDMLYYTEGPGAGPVTYEQAMVGYWGEAVLRAIKMGHGETLDFVREQAREFGWHALMELKDSPVPFPYTSPIDRNRRTRGMAAIAAPAITRADIDRAQAARKSTAEVDRDLDSWDDPDR